jgi:hypothetical protein
MAGFCISAAEGAPAARPLRIYRSRSRPCRHRPGRRPSADRDRCYRTCWPSARNRHSLRAGFLDPVIAAAGRIAAVAHFRYHALQPDRAGLFVHRRSVDLEAFAELDCGLGDQLFQVKFTFLERQFPQVVAIEIGRRRPSTMLFDLSLSSFCSTEKSVLPSAAGTTISPSMMAEPALMC